jgi:hypothetical protein
MVKNDRYYLEQTPRSLAKKIIDSIEWKQNENVAEPFRGEGSIYDQLPDYVNKTYAEIEEDIDFRDLDYVGIDTIITNPPYDISEGPRIRKNNFYKIVLYFSTTSVPRIILLCSQVCFNSLTPRRLQELNKNNLFIKDITVCNCKKWYGRYYLLTFTREPNLLFKYFLESFD